LSDQELLDLAKAAVGAEYELTPEQSRRLRGQTACELRADAKAMRRELGLPVDDPRDDGGRFAPRTSTGRGFDMNAFIRENGMTTGPDMNALIRSAAGRDPTPETPVEEPIGDAGLGRGGGAARRLDTDPHEAMNRTIRNAAAVRRGLIPFTDLTN
jgi:hypothetical protein